MRTNISRLAVLGLAAISGQAFAAVNISGQVRLDANFVSKPDTASDTFDLKRVRLDVTGDVSSDWSAGLRLQSEADADTNDSSTNVKLVRAYAKWTALENNVLTIGRAGHISADADDTYYTPHIEFHGSLDGFDSDDDGISLKGSMGAFGYKLALVQFEDTSNTSESLSWSHGGRLNFTAMSSDKMSWGGGIGMVGLKKPPETYTITTNPGGGVDNVNIVHTFKKYDGFKLDFSAVMGKMSFTAAYYDAKKKYDSSTVGGTAQAPNANDPFGKDGKQSSYYLEGTYLVMGDGYGFAHGTIQDPKFNSSALELGFRASRKTLKGVSALDLTNLAATVTYNNDGGVVTTYAATDSFERKVKAMSIFGNYHVNSNAAVKVEYYDAKTNYNQNVNLNTTTPAYPEVKNKQVTVRAEFNF